MRPLFLLLSTVYISALFFFADSPMVSTMAPYNPNSFLHIPLYGILTVLLVLAFIPLKDIPFMRRDQATLRKLTQLNPPADSTARIRPVDRIRPATRLLIAGFIAGTVAIADEFHQSFILTRDGSITDVFLDLVGISFVIFCLRRLWKNC